MALNTSYKLMSPKSVYIYIYFFFCFFFFFFFFCVLGLKKRNYTLGHSTTPFLVMVIFGIGFYKLFAWAGFETWSFWSLPPESLGLQAWTTSPQPQVYICSQVFFLKSRVMDRIWLSTQHLHVDCSMDKSNIACLNANSWFPSPDNLPLAVLSIAIKCSSGIVF
jgi:hypothetical protein